jgi:hypothetical protein
MGLVDINKQQRDKAKEISEGLVERVKRLHAAAVEKPLSFSQGESPPSEEPSNVGRGETSQPEAGSA